MPRNSADALDSLDDDWLIDQTPDDGGVRYSAVHSGDVESWPAPRTGNSDKNRLGPGALKPSAHSQGPFDAYAFLRNTEPYSDNARGFGRARRPDAAGAGDPGDSSTRTEVRSPTRTEVRSPTRTSTYANTRGNFTSTVTGGAGAGATSVTINVPSRATDAGDLHDNIRGWQDEAKQIILKQNPKLDQSGAHDPGLTGFDKDLAYVFFDIDTAAGTDNASQVMNDAHQRVRAIASKRLKQSLSPATEAALLALFQKVQANTPGGKSLLGKIASGVGSVGKVAGSIVSGIARPIGSLVTSIPHLAVDVATGKNVFQSLKDTVKRDLDSAKAIAPYAQAVLSVVPGVGQGVNAAIAAGAALAHGQSITDALVAGVKGMVPGGPLAAQALDTAYQLAKGKNLVAAVAEGLRNQLPPGPAQTAFDTGLALAHGANLQDTLIAQGVNLAKSVVPGGALGQAAVDLGGKIASGQNVASSALALAKDQGMNLINGAVQRLSPVATSPMNSLGPTIGRILPQVTSLVPTDVRMAAQSILKNPTLRSLPIEDVARNLNIPVLTARSAVASLVDSVSRAGGPSIPHLSNAHDLASRLSNKGTFDQAMSSFASKAAGPQFSHNARRVIQWSKAPGGYVSRVTEARGLDGSGTAYIVDPGDSMSKIATKVVGSAGRVGELIAANPQVKNPNVIQVGQRLNLPVSWQKAVQAGPSPTPAGPATVMSTSVPTGNPSSPVATISTTHATIKQGSTGPDVKLWQSIVGVTADGQFGPGTDAATRAWQASRGLTPDGIVGPNTWAKAAGSPSVSVSSVPTGPVTTVVTYVVKSGDSPFNIAKAFTGNGARFTELAAANPSHQSDINAGKIFPGEVLTVPPSWGAAPNGSPVPVAPASVPQVLSQLPSVLPAVLSQLPQIIPGLNPAPTTISENPASTVPAVFLPGSTSTTQTPDGPVTQTTDKSGSVVSVSQPAIGGDAPKSNTGVLVAAAVVLGGILLLGKGSSSKLA